MKDSSSLKKYLSYLLLVVFLISSFGAFAQVEISLLEQFNGKYDFLSIGATMNEDDNLVIIDGQSTFVTTDNSSATLTLPADATVVKAYLYWAESYGNNNETITLNGENFTADEVFYEDFSSVDFFFIMVIGKT